EHRSGCTTAQGFGRSFGHGKWQREQPSGRIAPYRERGGVPVLKKSRWLLLKTRRESEDGTSPGRSCFPAELSRV
ncbi:MAG TPA: hypothetical protein VGH38_09900, partial [Bryobacteraceae bacterium]